MITSSLQTITITMTPNCALSLVQVTYIPMIEDLLICESRSDDVLDGGYKLCNFLYFIPLLSDRSTRNFLMAMEPLYYHTGHYYKQG